MTDEKKRTEPPENNPFKVGPKDVLLTQVKEDLSDWGRKRFWLILLIVSVFGLFGGRMLIVWTVTGRVDEKLKSFEDTIHSSLKDAMKASAKADEASALITELDKYALELNRKYGQLEQQSTEMVGTIQRLQVAAKAVEDINEAEKFVDNIINNLKIHILPRIVKSELEPHLSKLDRLPEKDEVFTSSGVIKVNGEYRLKPPWGTTKDWNIIAIPLAPGNSASLPQKSIDTLHDEPEMVNITGYVNQYKCYIVRANNREWKIIANQTIEKAPFVRTPHPIDVYYLMIAKLQPRSK